MKEAFGLGALVGGLIGFKLGFKAGGFSPKRKLSKIRKTLGNQATRARHKVQEVAKRLDNAT